MRIWLDRPYRGKNTKEQVIGPGEVEVNDQLGDYLLMNGQGKRLGTALKEQRRDYERFIGEEVQRFPDSGNGIDTPLREVKDARTGEPIKVPGPSALDNAAENIGQSVIDAVSKLQLDDVESDYDAMTKAELIEEGKQRNLPVSTDMKKDDLIALLKGK